MGNQPTNAPRRLHRAVRHWHAVVSRVRRAARAYLPVWALHPLSGLGYFMRSIAWNVRRSPHLLASLPALLAAAVVVAFVVAAWQNSDAALRARYLQAGDQAARTGEPGLARTWYLKAIALGENSPEVRYRLALCQEALGWPAAAEALLAPLTEAGPNGYAPAHLHRARRRLADADHDPHAVPEAVAQLERALARQPELTEAHLLLGNLYWSIGRREEAELHLLKAAREKPALYLLLANHALAGGDVARAQRFARLALDYFRGELGQEVNEAASLGCCQAHLLLEEYDAAVAILVKARQRRDTPALRQSLGGAYAAWAEALKRQRPADLGARLRLLVEGLRAAPNDARLLQPLIELSTLPGREADIARTTLEQLLAEGPPSGVLHLLLGLNAWQHGQQDAARIHLEQAYRLAPDAAVVGNNLACMLAEGPHPDLPRALALADAAVARWPEQPHFRDTRGQVLVKLGRYQEALVDLELAQRGLPDNAALHAALATAYEKLGMPGIAERHRQRQERK